MLVVCPSHVFKRKPRPICSVKIFKGDGRELHNKNAEERGSSVVAIPRTQMYEPLSESLILSLPGPEIIPLQP